MEFDRLVACLKPDLLAIGGPGDDARSLFRDESLSRFSTYAIFPMPINEM